MVVNQWASWCPNCKAGFGFFQRLAQRYSRQVAFVGLDSQDRRSDAQAFLRGFPMPYPSIYDPSAREARPVGGGQGWPTTVLDEQAGTRFRREIEARIEHVAGKAERGSAAGEGGIAPAASATQVAGFMSDPDCHIEEWRGRHP